MKNIWTKTLICNWQWENNEMQKHVLDSERCVHLSDSGEHREIQGMD